MRVPVTGCVGMCRSRSTSPTQTLLEAPRLGLLEDVRRSSMQVLRHKPSGNVYCTAGLGLEVVAVLTKELCSSEG